MGLKGLFCMNFGHSFGKYPACQSVWCRRCYLAAESDNFHINQLTDEDGDPIYDCPSDKYRYKIGMDGAQFSVPFMCDLCLFRLLFKHNPVKIIHDNDSLAIIRRLNLDAIWSREPSTIASNLRSLSKLISTCEVAGMDPNLPSLGPLPFVDNFGYCVAFSMLVHSRQPGKHSKLYTQFATIRKQRSAFSNLYMASVEIFGATTLLHHGSMTNGILASCPTNSQWFTRWSLGCETRMGFILKQNKAKAISVNLLKAMIESFKMDIKASDNLMAADTWRAVLGLTYSVITFFASLRGSEGLKVNCSSLIKHWERGLQVNERDRKLHTSNLDASNIPHIIIPITGRLKGEQGERSHLLVLANVSKSKIGIRSSVKLMLTIRSLHNINSLWLFTDLKGNKVSFEDMNDIILDKLELLKYETRLDNRLNLKDINVREDFSINRSFRRGSSTSAQIEQIPTDIIELINRWKKIERAKGKKPKLSMIKTYADVELLVPKLVQYSERL